MIRGVAEEIAILKMGAPRKIKKKRIVSITSMAGRLELIYWLTPRVTRGNSINTALSVRDLRERPFKADRLLY